MSPAELAKRVMSTVSHSSSNCLQSPTTISCTPQILELCGNSDDCQFLWGVYTKVLLNEESFLEQLEKRLDRIAGSGAWQVGVKVYWQDRVRPLLRRHCPSYLPSGYSQDLGWPWLPAIGRTPCAECGEEREERRKRRGSSAETLQFGIKIQVWKYLYIFFWPRCCVTLGRRTFKTYKELSVLFSFVVCSCCLPKKEIVWPE